MGENTKQCSLALLSMLLALGLICSYVESLIPFYFGVPGVKLGLTNIVVLFALYLFGEKEAFTISIMRIILVGFLFGNLFSIVYSLAGGILSLVVMMLLKKYAKVNILSVSVAGGIVHNLGQLIIVAILVDNYNVFYYMTVLFISGVITGFLIGIISREVLIRLNGSLRSLIKR